MRPTSFPPLRLPLAAAAALTLAACVIPLDKTPPAVPTPAPVVVAPPVVAGVPVGAGGGSASARLTTTAARVQLAVGQERGLMDLLRDGNGIAPTSGVLWVSTNPNALTVNPLTGQVKALTTGTTVVTATLQANPTVRTQIEVEVARTGTITNIVVEPSTPTLAVGERKPFTATVYNADGTITGNVVWSSSDDTIASVNTAGQVKAHKPGKVTIEATAASDNAYKGVAIVTVIDARPTPSATPATAATATPAPSASPAASPSASPSSEASAAPTATPDATPTPGPTPTPTPEPTATPAA